MSKQDSHNNPNEQGKTTHEALGFGEARKAKRARFEAGGKTKGERQTRGLSRWVRVGTLVAVVVIGAISFGVISLVQGSTADPVTPTTAVTTQTDSGADLSASSDGDLRLPASTFDDGEAKFYSTNVGGKTVKFFVLKSSDGVIRAAFDTCDVCYPAKRGYHQEGDEMVCNNCGQRFPSVRINDVKGGCNPAPLTRSLEGDSLVIKASDVAKGARYF